MIEKKKCIVGQEIIPPEDEETCPLCDGTGEVEDMLYICDDSTGYNSIVEGTGKFSRCPDCNDDDDSDDAYRQFRDQ